MSEPARAILVATLALTAALAGCVTAELDLPITPLRDSVERFDGTLTFPPPVLLDASGAPVDPAAVAWLADMPWGVEQLVPAAGAEPNIGVTSSGALFVTTFDQVQRSRDQGRTWEVVHDFVFPGHPVTQDQWSTADPMLWVDTATDRVYVNHMHPALFCTFMAWSDDEGETWTERPMACSTPGIDHQKVMTAPPAMGLPMPDYPNVLYVCNNKRFEPLGVMPQGMGTSCYVSLDGGRTYAWETEAYVNDALCGNVNGHPAAFPDGAVAMVLGNLGAKCERSFSVVVTEDNGLTWDLRQCAEDMGQLEIDADITVTPDGTAYALFRHEDQMAHLIRSTDKFVTCDVFRVAPPDHTLSVFAGITSGDDGRIAMSYLGTRDPQPPGATPSNATPGSRWHAFVTTSFDADAESPTFLTQQVTPDEDPVQVGCVWLGGSGGGNVFNCRNLYDFIDMTRDSDGRWYVAITDGCNPRNGCTGTPDQTDFQSRDSQVAVLVQDRGVSLLQSKGILKSIGLAPPTPLPYDFD